MLEAFARGAGGAVTVAGGLVLAGWAFDVAALKSVFAGLVTMKPNTALAFVLAGLSLRSLGGAEATPRRRRVAEACAAVAAAIGLLTLSEHLVGWDLRIDGLLFAERAGVVATARPGQMSLVTALGLAVTGLALLLLHRGRWPRLAQVLGLGAGLVSLLAFLGYVYAVPSLRGIFTHTDMALHTALLLMLLAVGVLCARPGCGLMATVSSEHLGGVAARRLLPSVIVGPLAVGWLLQQELAREDLYAALGLPFILVLVVVVAGFLVSLSARSLDRIDAEREAAEAVSRRSEANFREILTTAPDAVLLVDRAGRIVFVNTQAERMFGYARDALLDRPVETLLPERARAAHGGHRDDYHAAPTVRPMGIGLDLLARRRDGSEFPVEISLSPLETETGPVVISTIRDVTDRKRAEEAIRALNAELEQRVAARTAELAVANRELEAFAYSVSHDLRAPLRAADGFSRMLIEKHGPQLTPEARRYLDVVRESTQKMGQLIDDLLAFSRLSRQPLAKRDVDAVSLVREVLADLRAEQESRRVETAVGELPACRADPALLRQVFVNLLSNALKFTRGREVARVEVGCRRDGADTVWFVRDNGIGFDMRYADKLFGVFSRLHQAEEFEGTGVGLAIVQRIVHRHGGRVWAEAQVDQGTTVYFTLEGGENHA